MEKEKTTILESIMIGLLIIIVVYPTVRWIHEDIQEERNRDVVRACINGSFSQKIGYLNESLLYYDLSGEMKATDIARYVELTNEAVNEIKAYLNCVDVDLLNNR